MYLFLCIVSFISVFPLYWMVSAATNKSAEVISGRLVPGTYFIENLKNLLATQNIGRALGNSFKYSLILTFVSLIVCSLAGYGFEIYHDKAKDAVMSIILLAMMVPFVATMIPLFQMVSKAGWLNTTIGFILPTISTPFLIMMFRQNARAFPIDIIEAARIDGATPLDIYVKIIVPLSKAPLVTVAIFTFTSCWNDFMGPLIYLSSSSKKTVQLMLRMFNTQYSSNYAQIMAAATVALVPVLILFIFLQRYFVEGIASSGIKG